MSVPQDIEEVGEVLLDSLVFSFFSCFLSVGIESFLVLVFCVLQMFVNLVTGFEFIDFLYGFVADDGFWVESFEFVSEEHFEESIIEDVHFIF